MFDSDSTTMWQSEENNLEPKQLVFEFAKPVEFKNLVIMKPINLESALMTTERGRFNHVCLVLWDDSPETHRLCTNKPNGFDDEDGSDFINFKLRKRNVRKAKLTFNLPHFARISELELFYEFYGLCYEDEESPFQILNLAEQQFDDLTVEKCIDFCREKEAEYAGVRDGNTCQCGNGHRVKQLGSDTRWGIVVYVLRPNNTQKNIS